MAEPDARGQEQRRKVAIVNGRLSERSFRGYRRVRTLLKPMLDRIDLVAAQNEEYADRFLATWELLRTEFK